MTEKEKKQIRSAYRQQYYRHKAAVEAREHSDKIIKANEIYAKKHKL